MLSLELVNKKLNPLKLDIEPESDTSNKRSKFSEYQLALLKILNNNFFWSGVVFAFAFWIKQQVIMILPVLVLFHLKNKSWLDILHFIIWTLPVIVLFALGLNTFRMDRWEQTLIIGLLGLSYITISLCAFAAKTDKWQYARYQGL